MKFVNFHIIILLYIHIFTNIFCNQFNIQMQQIKKDDNHNYIINLNTIKKGQQNNKLHADIIEQLNKRIPSSRNNNNLMRKANTNNKNQTHEYIYTGDYITTNRTLQIYINQSFGCDILIKDKMTYENLTAGINLVDHLILHNNVDGISPSIVVSDDVNVEIYTYNKVVDMFSVYYNNDKKLEKFTIEYDYLAERLLKSEANKLNSTEKNNMFIWKILNENLEDGDQNIKIEVYFNLGNKKFENEEVIFSKQFTKSLIKNNDTEVTNNKNNSTVVKYSWEGKLEPQELMVLQATFPEYIKSCDAFKLSLGNIIIGSVFLIIFITSLYFLISPPISDDL
jgi:hypothetical protein